MNELDCLHVLWSSHLAHRNCDVFFVLIGAGHARQSCLEKGKLQHKDASIFLTVEIYTQQQLEQTCKVNIPSSSAPDA
jgi:hypothetical protein